MTGPLAQERPYRGYASELADHLYRTQAVDLLAAPRLKLVSRPGEAEGDFRARIGLALREQRDAKVDDLKRRYAPKLATLEERLRKAQASAEREHEQARSAQVNVALEVGASILGSIFGRRRSGTSAARRAGRALEQRGDVGRAEDTVAAVSERLQALEQEFRAETAALDASLDPLTEAVEPVQVRPRKSDVDVMLVALALAPHWRDAGGAMTPAWR